MTATLEHRAATPVAKPVRAAVLPTAAEPSFLPSPTLVPVM